MFKTGKIIFLNGQKKVEWSTARYQTHAAASEALMAQRPPIQKTKH